MTRLGVAQAAEGHDVTLLSRDVTADQDAVRDAWASVPGHDTATLRFVDDHGDTSPVVADADFVHLHGVWEPVLLHAARAARQHHTPYTVTPHGMLDPWALSQKKLKKRIALTMFYRRMLSGAAFVHMLNDDEVRRATPVGFRSPSRVIPNGITLEELDPLPSEGTFRTAHPELADRPFVLFLGRLHYKKGLDILAQAFTALAAQHAEVDLVVVGPDEGAEAGFVSAIHAADLAGRVHVLGPVYGRDKLAALVDAACFCLPSRQEGFSIAILEALASGCPVVVSEACHFPELAEQDAGHVVPLEPEAIARHLLEVLADPAAAVAMGARGRRLVEQRFTWDKVARSMLVAYDEFRLQ